MPNAELSCKAVLQQDTPHLPAALQMKFTMQQFVSQIHQISLI